MQTLQKRLEIWGQNERHQGRAGGAAKCGFVYSEAERWDVLLTNKVSHLSTKEGDECCKDVTVNNVAANEVISLKMKGLK